MCSGKELKILAAFSFSFIYDTYTYINYNFKKILAA